MEKFRHKITEPGGGVVHDSVPGGSDDMDNANPQVLGGGSIVIHRDIQYSAPAVWRRLSKLP